jgi:hypothetical protein
MRGLYSKLFINASRLFVAGHYGYALREDLSLTIGALNICRQWSIIDANQERKTHEDSQRIVKNRTELHGQRC